MTLMDLEFANDVMTAEGQAVDKAALKRWRAEVAAEKAEAFRKGRCVGGLRAAHWRRSSTETSEVSPIA